MLIHKSSIRNNAVHELTLITMTVAHILGTGNFLIKYSNHHAK